MIILCAVPISLWPMLGKYNLYSYTRLLNNYDQILVLFVYQKNHHSKSLFHRIIDRICLCDYKSKMIIFCCKNWFYMTEFMISCILIHFTSTH